MAKKPQQLTIRQHQIVRAIWQSWCNTGLGPTIRELADAVGIKNPNGVRGQLILLMRKGAIEVVPGMDRGIWPSGLSIKVKDTTFAALTAWEKRQQKIGFKTTGHGMRTS